MTSVTGLNPKRGSAPSVGSGTESRLTSSDRRLRAFGHTRSNRPCRGLPTFPASEHDRAPLDKTQDKNSHGLRHRYGPGMPGPCREEEATGRKFTGHKRRWQIHWK